jgi:hypothetical protein
MSLILCRWRNHEIALIDHGEAEKIAEAQSRKLFQLRVLRFGSDEDRNVWVGVFPEGEEILRLGFLQDNDVRIIVATHDGEALAILRQAE